MHISINDKLRVKEEMSFSFFLLILKAVVSFDLDNQTDNVEMILILFVSFKVNRLTQIFLYIVRHFKQ